MSNTGLFDGFEYYRTPTDADYRSVLKTGLVVLDTNVLLNLYRYTSDAREDLLSVLAHLGDRLWLPRQAVEEFWRNREGVLRDRPEDARKTIAALEESLSKGLADIRTWANRVSLPDTKRDSLLEDLTTAVRAITARISTEGEGRDLSIDTSEDPVLRALEPLVRGKVGEDFTQEERQRAEQEGARRLADRLPPGYKDGRTGDYLVWEQTLKEASLRGVDVLFVTGDVKEDWWRIEQGQKRGPRKELFDELMARSEARLFMMRPGTLLEIAPAALPVTVRTDSSSLVNKVDEQVIRRGETRRLILSGEYEAAERNFTRIIGVADLDVAARLNPDRADTKLIRQAMEEGRWAPRGDLLSQASIAEFVDALSSGDALAALAAQEKAEQTGLSNPAYICINRAMVDILSGQPEAAERTLERLAPEQLGPYVRINMEILRILTKSQSGQTVSTDQLDAAWRLRPDFDYKAGPISWLESGLTNTSQLTAESARLFKHLDGQPNPRRRTRTRAGEPLDSASPDD